MCKYTKEFEEKYIKEPTYEQCDAVEKMFESEHHLGHAIWYPQMGGYRAKAVVVFNKDKKGDCVEAYVWHDGEFPFSEYDIRNKGNPAFLHHCVPEQFVIFGEQLIEKNGASDLYEDV